MMDAEVLGIESLMRVTSGSGTVLGSRFVGGCGVYRARFAVSWSSVSCWVG